MNYFDTYRGLTNFASRTLERQSSPTVNSEIVFSHLQRFFDQRWDPSFPKVAGTSIATYATFRLTSKLLAGKIKNLENEIIIAQAVTTYGIAPESYTEDETVDVLGRMYKKKSNAEKTVANLKKIPIVASLLAGAATYVGLSMIGY